MSLPTADAVVDGYAFLARRMRLEDRAISVVGVRAALDDAERLANGDAALEPAAIFFAFARRPRITRGAWVNLASVLAENQARTRALTIREARSEFRVMCVRIAGGESFDAVRAWLDARLVPLDAP